MSIKNIVDCVFIMLLLVHYPQDFTLDKSDLTPFSGPYFVFLQSRLMFVNNQRCLLFPRKKKKKTFYLLTWKNQRINKSFFSVHVAAQKQWCYYP